MWTEGGSDTWSGWRWEVGHADEVRGVDRYSDRSLRVDHDRAIGGDLRTTLHVHTHTHYIRYVYTPANTPRTQGVVCIRDTGDR